MTLPHRRLGLAALAGGVLAVLGACQGSNSGNTSAPSAPLAIAGTYEDFSGSPYTLTNSDWTDASGTYAVARFDNSATFLVAQNGSNAANPGLWSRFDWTVYWSDVYVCHSVNNAPNATDSTLGTGADGTNPTVGGCGGVSTPWAHLVAPLPITGAYVDIYGDTQTVTESIWFDGFFHYTVLEYWDHGMFLVAKNDPTDLTFGGDFSRFDWVTSQGHLYYCQTAFDAVDRATAMNTARSDDTNPSTGGCGGVFPWTQLN